MRGEREASIWVVVPAYNEAPVIAPVITHLIKLNYSVIIVDDGSSDRSGQVDGLAGARVVTHPFNLGQGAALQTGKVRPAAGRRLYHLIRRGRAAPSSGYRTPRRGTAAA